MVKIKQRSRKNKPKRRRIIAAALISALIVAGIVFILVKVDQNKSEREKQNRETGPVVTIRLEAKNFSSVSGWHNGREVSWYNFEQAGAEVGNIYVLVTGYDNGQNPQPLQNQKDIFDRKKEEMQTVPFWRIQYVTVPGDYRADSAKSVSDIASHSWPTKDSGKIVNRPFIIESDTITPDRAKNSGWADGEQVHYWQFEDNVLRNINDDGKIAAGKVYTLISSYDSKGAPIRVPDQKDIVESVPGNVGYSPLKRIVFVTVPADYQADSIKSKDEIVKRGYTINETNFYLNLPLYQIEGKPVSVAVSAPSPEAQSSSVPATPSKPVPKTAAKSKISVSTLGRSSAQISVEQEVAGTQVGQMVKVTVSIENLSFQPALVDIPQDSVVAWINNDSVPHTVTADDGGFDSGILEPGQSFQMVFTGPGSRTYHCLIHPSMRGSINVH